METIVKLIYRRLTAIRKARGQDNMATISEISGFRVTPSSFADSLIVSDYKVSIVICSDGSHYDSGLEIINLANAFLNVNDIIDGLVKHINNDLDKALELCRNI